MADHMRNRIYKAEELFYAAAQLTQDDLLRKAGRVVTSAWWTKRTTRNPNVYISTRSARCEPDYSGTHFHNILVRTGRTHLNFLWVLHALAHTLTDDRRRQDPNDAVDTDHRHDAHFVTTYLDIVGRFIGSEFRSALKKALLEQKVKTKVVSTETREKMRDHWVHRNLPGVRDSLQQIAKDLENM